MPRTLRPRRRSAELEVSAVMRTPKQKRPTPPPPAALPFVAALATKPKRCVVCGDPVAQFSTEDLCWVCRRLKISAWKDAETQPSPQE
jgi:hypothetical protein